MYYFDPNDMTDPTIKRCRDMGDMKEYREERKVQNKPFPKKVLSRG